MIEKRLKSGAFENAGEAFSTKTLISLAFQQFTGENKNLWGILKSFSLTFQTNHILYQYPTRESRG